MPRVDVVVETPTSRSVRARQLEGMFDVPAQEKCRLQWTMDVPLDDEPWNVGLIVGPSEAGKSTMAHALFGKFETPQMWQGASVIDDIAPGRPITEVTEACQAVGFNTIPAWLRPYGVLSNGEKFRVSLARTLLESGDLAVVDEFTSTVDRQVAQIGAHAVQKMVRRRGSKFVAVTCHYDVLEWLQPDWILEPHTRSFQRRLVQPRPRINCTISPVPWTTWHMFAPFHYMSAALHRAARCVVLFVNGRAASLLAWLWVPISIGPKKGQCYIRVSRLVTLPDFQGLGLALVLADFTGALHRALGRSVRTYPAHPSLVRAFDRSPRWSMTKRPGQIRNPGSKLHQAELGSSATLVKGGRPCATFQYCGPALDNETAHRVISYWNKESV